MNKEVKETNKEKMLRLNSTVVSIHDQKSNCLLDESCINELGDSTFYPIYRNMISNHKYKSKDKLNPDILK